MRSGGFAPRHLSHSQNQSYNISLADDSGNFTYSVTSGSLPPGLSLTTTNFAPTATVAITGTPTQGETYNFTITATDGNDTSSTNYSLMVVAPTAAGLTVGGRVKTATGQGIRNARVLLTDSQGITRTALTSPFGYYRFADVPAGETYIFSVTSKSYQFNQNTQLRSIAEETDDIDFIADK